MGSTKPRPRLSLRLIPRICLLLAAANGIGARPACGANDPVLSPRNLEAPFPYPIGGEREWPILERPLPPGTRVVLTARVGEREVARGARLEIEGLTIAVTEAGRLSVRGKPTAQPGSWQLEIQLTFPDGGEERQILVVRPAPPDRPISYYADFGDDLIRIFMDPTTGRFRPLSKNGFDQFFRRLQAHGTRRLIVWLSPFPYAADPKNYAEPDWRRYERQARAILDDPALSQSLDARSGFASWSWIRYLMATRLRPDFGRLLGQSAVEHGIALTISYRPFEAALTKYYEVPAFDDEGAYLWGFLPLASPTVNYHPDDVGWRHYRDHLRELGRPEAAELGSIEFPGVIDPARFAGKPGLRITASQFPPLAEDSFVLVRDAEGAFELRQFAGLRQKAEARLERLDGFHVELSRDGLRVVHLKCSNDVRYLIFTWEGPGEGPDLDALSPIVLRAKAGNLLGRETTYWVQGEPNDSTRVAGITRDGEFRAEFQASEFSQRQAAAGPKRLSLAGRHLVVDLGAPSTVEMIDFNQPLARNNAVREMATLLELPGFDELLLNTRSHVDLPLSTADGDDGTRPAGLYWHERRGPRVHLGLDKAYAPRSERGEKRLREVVDEPGGIEQITSWQPGEWRGSCQTAEGPPWRFARNAATAEGVRKLLEDFERAFPGRRIRVLIPPREEAVQRIEEALEVLERPGGGPYGRDFFQQLWPGNNHAPAVGEGLALLDLRDLKAAPVFLGSGGTVTGPRPLELYVRECVADMAGNRGSSYQGPRSYFYEGQTTLRAADAAGAQMGRAAREETIRHLLSQQGEIGDVILYESADWLYFLPLSDPDLCGHGFLDRLPQ